MRWPSFRRTLPMSSKVLFGVAGALSLVSFLVVRSEVGVADLRAWCAERLSDYKVPETIDLSTDPLPRNANGKVLKRQLREARASS